MKTSAGLFVHCSDDLSYSSGTKGATDSDIFCVKKISANDTFTIFEANKTQIEDHSIVSFVKFLQEYKRNPIEEKRQEVLEIFHRFHQAAAIPVAKIQG